MNEVIEREVGTSMPVQSTAQVTPMRLLEIATQRGDDLDKLKQLMDLQDRWEATEARKAFTVAMTEFKANPPAILKSKQVNIPNGARFAHATLADVCDGVCATLSKHGLSHRWETAQSADSLISVTCTITHRLGHKESVTLTASPDDSGKKNGIQQIASTVTYLQRYTLMAATGLAARDMDDDGRGAGNGGGKQDEEAPDPEGKKALEACATMPNLTKCWNGLPKEKRATLSGVMNECRARIKEADKE